MKRIVLLIVVLAAGFGVAVSTYPNEIKRYAPMVKKAGLRAWEGVESNPLPVGFALGTFLLTVIYHKAQGKSLRESVEVAATRVTVVSVPAASATPVAVEENPVIARAKARATRTQLLADQIALENRHRKLPEELLKAEKETCYTEQAVADSKRSLGAKWKAHNVALAKLDALRKEKAAGDAELAAIAAELNKLAELV